MTVLAPWSFGALILNGHGRVVRVVDTRSWLSWLGEDHAKSRHTTLANLAIQTPELFLSKRLNDAKSENQSMRSSIDEK